MNNIENTGMPYNDSFVEFEKRLINPSLQFHMVSLKKFKSTLKLYNITGNIDKFKTLFDEICLDLHEFLQFFISFHIDTLKVVPFDFVMMEQTEILEEEFNELINLCIDTIDDIDSTLYASNQRLVRYLQTLSYREWLVRISPHFSEMYLATVN